MRIIKYEELNIVKNLLWDKKYLQPLTENLRDILDYTEGNTFKNTALLLDFNESIKEASNKFMQYGVSSDTNVVYSRLVENEITDEIGYFYFIMLNDILKEYDIDKIPVSVLIDYTELKDRYTKMDLLKNIDTINISEDDVYSNKNLDIHIGMDAKVIYVVEKYFTLIRHYSLKSVYDDYFFNEVVRYLTEANEELLELCRNEVNVEDILVFTHSTEPINVVLHRDLAEEFIPVICEVTGTCLTDSLPF